MNCLAIIGLGVFLYGLGVYFLMLFMKGASERRGEDHLDEDHRMIRASERRVKDHRK